MVVIIWIVVGLVDFESWFSVVVIFDWLIVGCFFVMLSVVLIKLVVFLCGNDFIVLRIVLSDFNVLFLFKVMWDRVSIFVVCLFFLFLVDCCVFLGFLVVCRVKMRWWSVSGFLVCVDMIILFVWWLFFVYYLRNVVFGWFVVRFFFFCFISVEIKVMIFEVVFIKCGIIW